MTLKRVSASLALVATVGVLVLGACGDGVGPQDPRLVRLLIEPESATVFVARTLDFRARGAFSDGSTRDVPATFSATGGYVPAGGAYLVT
jgi:hypothetical protein